MKPTPNMSSSKPRKPTVTNIGSILIEFPFQPYGSQLFFMSRVIATLDRAQRDGHFHALLESPTGTGKSLSLLCSVIAWQENQKVKSIGYGSVGGFISKEDPEAMEDPFGRGRGSFQKSSLQCVPQNTTTPAGEGFSIPLSTPDEIVAGQPDPRLAKKSKDPPKRKTISTSVTPSEPRQPSRKRRLKKKASEAGSSAPMVEQTEGLDDTDMSNFYAELEDCLEGDESIPVKVVFTPTPHFGRSLAQRVSAVGGFVGKTGDEDVRRHVDPLDALANSALSHDAEYDEIQEDGLCVTGMGLACSRGLIFCSKKDRGLCFPWNLSNRVNVSPLVCLFLNDELVQTDAKLSDQALVVRNLQNELALERTKSQGCVSSDEFIAALARFLTLGITFVVERGLRMGRTDAEFEVDA
ncbi:fanconi anemia group J protein [Tanacetum coccineum]